jgi:homoserine acetyltransferase
VGDRLTGVGIPGDLLYPAESVREWTTAANATYVELPSIHGHDAFLLEVDRVAAVIAKGPPVATAQVEKTPAAAKD